MKFGCLIGIFLSSAHLICRSTDISKYFRGSLRHRDNESRLYMTGLMTMRRTIPVVTYFHTFLVIPLQYIVWRFHVHSESWIPNEIFFMIVHGMYVEQVMRMCRVQEWQFMTMCRVHEWQLAFILWLLHPGSLTFSFLSDPYFTTLSNIFVILFSYVANYD